MAATHMWQWVLGAYQRLQAPAVSNDNEGVHWLE